MQVPKGWKNVPIEKLFDVKAGGDLQKEVFSTQKTSFFKYPIFANSLVKNGLYGYTSKPRYPKNCVTITGRGSLGHAEFRGERFDAIVRLLVLIPKQEVDCLYTTYFINGEVNFLSESTGVPQLPVPRIKNTIIALPPLPEQKKIAEILSACDECIENTEKQIAKLKDLKKATMQELLTKGIGHTEFKDSPLGRIPKSWEMVRLEDVAVKIQDGNYGADYPKKSDFIDEGIPFLTSKVIGGTGKINISKFDFISLVQHQKLKKAQLNGGDILFTNRGANVGQVAMYPQNYGEGNIGPQLTLIRHDSSKANREFVFYSVSGPHIQTQIQNEDSGSAMNFFGVLATKAFKLALPPLHEQNKIADILSSIDSYIENKEQKLNKLKDQKKALMNDLLTGKVRVSC